MSATDQCLLEAARERWLPLLLLVGAMMGPGLGLLAASVIAQDGPAPRPAEVSDASYAGEVSGEVSDTSHQAFRF